MYEGLNKGKFWAAAQVYWSTSWAYMASSGSSQDGQTVFLVYQMETKRVIQGVAVLTTSNL